MEITKKKLKQLIKEELLNLAELGEVGTLTPDEVKQLQGLLSKANPATLAALGLQKTEEK